MGSRSQLTLGPVPGTLPIGAVKRDPLVVRARLAFVGQAGEQLLQASQLVGVEYGVHDVGRVSEPREHELVEGNASGIGCAQLNAGVHGDLRLLTGAMTG